MDCSHFVCRGLGEYPQLFAKIGPAFVTRLLRLELSWCYLDVYIEAT